MPHTPRRPLNAGRKYLAAGQNSHLQQITGREMRKDQTRRTELGREGSGKGRMEAQRGMDGGRMENGMEMRTETKLKNIKWEGQMKREDLIWKTTKYSGICMNWRKS